MNNNNNNNINNIIDNLSLVQSECESILNNNNNNVNKGDKKGEKGTGQDRDVHIHSSKEVNGIMGQLEINRKIDERDNGIDEDEYEDSECSFHSASENESENYSQIRDNADGNNEFICCANPPRTLPKLPTLFPDELMQLIAKAVSLPLNEALKIFKDKKKWSEIDVLLMDELFVEFLTIVQRCIVSRPIKEAIKDMGEYIKSRNFEKINSRQEKRTLINKKTNIDNPKNLI